MKLYEVVCVFNPKLNEEKIDSIISRIEKRIKEAGGEVQSTKKWGIKKLAFTYKEAEGINQGYFILINFRGDSKILEELRNLLNVTENVLRYLISVSKGPVEEALEEEKVEIAPSMLGKETEI